MLVALAFVLVTRPVMDRWYEQLLKSPEINSEGGLEATSQMGAIGYIAGLVIYGGIGAAVGVLLAGVGFWRKENWKKSRWVSLVLNLIVALLVGYWLIHDIIVGAIRVAGQE
jgi:uncharacterized membrane protein